MKTKEFIKEAEALGFNSKILSKAVVVTSAKNGNTVLTIGGQKDCKIDCFYSAYDNLTPCIREKLFKLVVEYASTPLSERYEENKYYIKLKGTTGDGQYLNYDIEDDKYYIDDDYNSEIEITQFTEQEIKKYGLQKFADSELFELIKVK